MWVYKYAGWWLIITLQTAFAQAAWVWSEEDYCSWGVYSPGTVGIPAPRLLCQKWLILHTLTPWFHRSGYKSLGPHRNVPHKIQPPTPTTQHLFPILPSQSLWSLLGVNYRGTSGRRERQGVEWGWWAAGNAHLHLHLHQTTPVQGESFHQHNHCGIPYHYSLNPWAWFLIFVVFSVVFWHAFKSSINVDSLQGLSVHFKTDNSAYISWVQAYMCAGGGEESRGICLFSVPPHLIKET